jgi:hypothetical protein
VKHFTKAFFRSGLFSERGFYMNRELLRMGILVLAIFVGLFIVKCDKNANAGQAVAVGGQIHNGHSYSGDNKIDPPGYVGHGARLQFERGIDDERGLDFTYLFGIDFIRFGKRDNDTMRHRWEHAFTGLIEARVYSRHTRYFQPFVGVAVGSSSASDEFTGAIAGSFGVETRISESLSVETFGRVTATETRRHDTAGLLLKWRF